MGGLYSHYLITMIIVGFKTTDSFGNFDWFRLENMTHLKFTVTMKVDRSFLFSLNLKDFIKVFVKALKYVILVLQSFVFLLVEA